jgi:hypothetical protein
MVTPKEFLSSYVKKFSVKGFKKQYDLPFNPKNLKALHEMRPTEKPASVTLIIQRLG